MTRVGHCWRRRWLPLWYRSLATRLNIWIRIAVITMRLATRCRTHFTLIFRFSLLSWVSLRISIGHISETCRVDSSLHISYTCSIRIRSRNRVRVKILTSTQLNLYSPLASVAWTGCHRAPYLSVREFDCSSFAPPCLRCSCSLDSGC